MLSGGPGWFNPRGDLTIRAVGQFTTTAACVGQIGEQNFDIGRTAVLTAGWPESVAGVTIDRQCGSSQQSVRTSCGLRRPRS